ncbi:hypothetical protein A6D6_00682 [Alcanivorax xiamenensis]|uniref:DUF547 domain-containing protein n=1 Tax=Alcanivorax xiamenensis TaxID=1177156 RepID=A0ABQ6YC49_9GAMM|nr:DUF547 domain-containing protein [Alcanivorax xiamenensis]KAF0807685.1 hypothetical protein A6D6_00682 [Alcanivorax xiamenensis]
MRPLLTIALVLFTHTAIAFDHGDWDTLLKKHVHWVRGGVASQVDYQGMAADRPRLDRYLDDLSTVSERQFQDFDRNQQLAFLINAYNAFTLRLILDQTPHPDSIRDIGGLFSGPWDQRFFTLLGERRTLDEVEHGLIRDNPDLMDPRIHFAVNCASIGCPALRPEAYTSERLDWQLEDSTHRFLSDRSRNQFDQESRRLSVSSIFKWYRDDFANAAGDLGAWLADYSGPLGLTTRDADLLRDNRLAIRFLPYDWSLNGLPTDQ